MKHRYLVSLLGMVALAMGNICTPARSVTFTPPTNGGAPSQASGGASRGSLFTPPASNTAPRQASGGASRSNLFTPPASNVAPQKASGGAFRGDFFTPGAGHATPRQTGGGASRGNQFIPSPSSGSPRWTGSGASRGDWFTPVPGNESPRHTGSGASRVGPSDGDVVPTDINVPAALIALLPPSFYGTTLSERPTLLVYLPASNAEEAVFSLKDEAGITQYEMTLSVTGEEGILAITLPTDAPALKIGQPYQWFLALKLDGQLGPRTPYVDGWIQRIQPNAELIQAMKGRDALQRAIALGQQGVWYDCVATLAKLYAVQPTNITLIRHWQELLASVNLQEIQTVPMLTAVR